jgi:DNA-binding FadR family transcriptional regulator
MRGAPSRIALALAALLAALSLVAARQGKGMRVLSEVEAFEARIDVERARGDELVGEIRRLESRGVIEPRAAAELGMHTPVGDELRIFDGERR